MAAGEFYIARNVRSNEYLAERLFRGFYMTADVTNAIKCKDEIEMRRKIDKSGFDLSNFFIETITVYK